MMIDPDFAAMRFDGSRLARLRYAVKGRDHNGDERILERVATRKEAAESKADFQRTRGGEFARVWIERTA